MANPAPRLEPGDDALPKHVAIIMDGNGRWARARGQDRSFGHQQGAHTVRTIVTESARLGLEALTLYSFSTENWTRSPDEVAALMELLVAYLGSELPTMMDNNVRLKHIGHRENLPDHVLASLDETLDATANNTGLTLALAINYGSRSEITHAVQQIARKAKAGELNPDAITAEVIGEHLFTAGLPDPDLLIRTAGEMRLSNYLLWQVSYAELYVSDVCWPDFDEAHFHQALCAFAKRTRKFGAVVDE